MRDEVENAKHIDGCFAKSCDECVDVANLHAKDIVIMGTLNLSHLQSSRTASRKLFSGKVATTFQSSVFGFLSESCIKTTAAARRQAPCRHSVCHRPLRLSRERGASMARLLVPCPA